MTNHQAFLVVTGIIFGLVTLMHALRLTFRLQVKVNQREIPMVLSLGGLIIAAGLTFWAFWLLFH
jgi:hypothetical protein